MYEKKTDCNADSDITVDVNLFRYDRSKPKSIDFYGVHENTKLFETIS